MIQHSDAHAAATAILAKLNNQVVIGVPLGIGKPVGLLNALYDLAKANKQINLTIVTGLTLSRPFIKSALEKRFLQPILERLLPNYEDLHYEMDRMQQILPSNVTVIEFYLTPGKYVNNQYVQEHYISSSYAYAVQDAIHFGINVLAQQIAPPLDLPTHYSLSSNSDLFSATATALKKSGAPYAIYGEINSNLPYMRGDAVVAADQFTDILPLKNSPSLFPIPHEALSPQDHLIGLYSASLIKDGGSLQIGIGKLGMAVASGLITRQKEPHAFQLFLKELRVMEKFGELIRQEGGCEALQEGLYASTEMMSDEYMEIYRAGIIKRKVFDHVGLQQLINDKEISEPFTLDTLDKLMENKIIQAQLTSDELVFLHQFGFLNPAITLIKDELKFASGEMSAANLTNPKTRALIEQQGLGQTFKNGQVIHAGFFAGSGKFYQWLNQLTSDERDLIHMTNIARTNTLAWSPALATLQRQHARFINTSMLVTLNGCVVADAIENLKQVSGVGGQFDFVNMAKQLPDARLIIHCRSTRETRRGVQSNIVVQYPTITIPRYLRDIVVTEYGIADLRSKTDSDIIKELLKVTDSRFQETLLNQAKKLGKIAKDYVIPQAYRDNTPAAILKVVKELQTLNSCHSFPFGSELTPEEIRLTSVLTALKNLTTLGLVRTLFKAMLKSSPLHPETEQCLARLDLLKPKNWQDWIYKKLISYRLAS